MRHHPALLSSAGKYVRRAERILTARGLGEEVARKTRGKQTQRQSRAGGWARERDLGPRVGWLTRRLGGVELSGLLGKGRKV